MKLKLTLLLIISLLTLNFPASTNALTLQEILQGRDNPSSTSSGPSAGQVLGASTTGLVGYWKFDEGSGTAVGDFSGSNYNGVLIGGSVWGAGKVGTALTLNGANYVQINNSIFGAGAYTFCVWVKPDAPPGVFQYLTQAYPLDFYLWSNGGANVSVNISNTNTGNEAKSPETISAGAWHHVCAIRNSNNTATLYVDGAQSGTANQNAGAVSAAAANMRIGISVDGSWGYKGLIDELRVYNRVLSAQEILDVYNDLGGTSPTPTPTPTPTATPTPTPTPTPSPTPTPTSTPTPTPTPTPTVTPTPPASGCSGSGTAWSCAAGATVSQVQTVINNSSDGAVITFANGNYTWNSHISLNNKNGITLICATVRGCNVAFSGDVIGIDATPFVVTELIRISGFVFTGSPGTAALWFLGDRNINKLRIDNNTFRNFPSGYIAIMAGGTDAWITGYVYGVIDHNIFTGTNSFMAFKALTGKSWPTGLAGSANNIFLEDNTATFTTSPDYGGWVDSWMATGIVVRYNNLTNVRITSHGAGHGGPANTEWYGNTITSPTTANYRNMHHQGSGEIIIFNNTVTGGHIALLDYRSDVTQLPNGSAGVNNVCDGTQTGAWPDGNRLPITTYRGYPCYHQPGRDGGLNLKPLYLWGNKDENNAKVPVSIESGGYINNHLLANRDYYEAVSASAQTSPTSPFNGTTGMGFGTLANRPITCSTGLTDAADAGKGGVGYFATDTNTLYRCASANTWVVHYQPYTYPHPLVSGAVTPPPTPIPGDLNLDHIVNALDYSLLNSKWLQSFSAYDLQADGLINSLDFAILSSNWGKVW